MMSLGLAVGPMSTQRSTSQRPTCYDLLLVANAPPHATVMHQGWAFHVSWLFCLWHPLSLSRKGLLLLDIFMHPQGRPRQLT